MATVICWANNPRKTIQVFERILVHPPDRHSRTKYVLFKKLLRYDVLEPSHYRRNDRGEGVIALDN